MNKVLEIIGPYPPPIGGISIHIYRISLLLESHGIDYKIFNHGRLTAKNVTATKKSTFWYVKYLFCQRQGHLIHFHQFFMSHFLYYYIFSRITKKNIFVTIHDEKLLVGNRLIQKAIIYLLKNTRVTKLISVSQKLSNFLTQKGINNIWLPAYVPPAVINPVKIDRIEGKEYFLYSIWKIEKQTAEKIYNIKLAFELLKRTRDKYQMLFLIGSEDESDKDYLNSLLAEYNIQDSVKILFERQLTDYINQCQFLLRTNDIDGYGISLQEALDLGVPAIASDTCTRPNGTILFKKGDLEDLYEKVINKDKYWDKSKVESLDYHLNLIELYKKHLK